MALLDETAAAVAALRASFSEPVVRTAPADQPVHTLYWPADRFDANTVAHAGAQARQALAAFAPTPESLTAALDAPRQAPTILALEPAVNVAPAGWDRCVWSRTKARLQRGPVEDLRIDFEDGYGVRDDSEEDAHATAAAAAVSEALEAGTMCARVGIRVKCPEPQHLARSAATLERFVAGLRMWPETLVLTLPKVTRPEQVALADAWLLAIEGRYRRPRGSIRLEVMVETTESLVAADGRSPLPAIVDAGVPRLLGVHLGVYDFTAACGLAAAEQSPAHEYCRIARALVRFGVGDRVHVSDGASNVLPVGDADAVHRAWRIGYRVVTDALAEGYRQGWDMHPAQLVVRHAANIAFFRRGYPSIAKRLAALLERASGPGALTVQGAVIDEPATGHALHAAVSRAWRVGALTPTEFELSGLTVAETRAASFAVVVAGRRRVP